MSIEIYEKLKKKTWNGDQLLLRKKNPAHVLIYNLDKLQWIEKFCVRSTKPSQNNKSWNFQLYWTNLSWNIFSQSQKKTRFVKKRLELIVT